LLTVRSAQGAQRKLVFRTQRSDDFGHDRRADRAAEALLAYDTRAETPRHAGVVDVGAILSSGQVHSLRDAGELYWVTDFVPGEVYAEDLRRIGDGKKASADDLARCDELVAYLASLHAEKLGRPAEYRRAVRDLIGHGEGIFGIVDSYPDDMEPRTLDQVRRIEQRCAEWRWKLRGREARLSRTHGDFHPFNILFDEGGGLWLLDASRGCRGDPADDATCLAINFLFFGFEHQSSWTQGFGPLWRRFWEGYLEKTGDQELLTVAPPYFAWRALVVANPLWYPNAHADVRYRLLGFAERALTDGRLEPADAEELFR
jgi:aminoglycoside phosphotransferase (APT) family kinase protein